MKAITVQTVEKYDEKLLLSVLFVCSNTDGAYEFLPML